MNNILVHSNYSPANHGGIEFVVSLLLKIFPARDRITCFYGGEKNQTISKNDKLKYISRRILFKAGGASLLSWGNLSFIAYSLRSNLILFQEPYPTLWPAILILRGILRKKIIVLVHANPVSKTWIMRLYNKTRSFVFSGAICVTTSPKLLSQIDSSRFLRTAVIPLCIPDQPLSYKKNLNLKSHFALYIGRLAKYKGIECLLESAKLCPKVNFVIAGEGVLAGYVCNFIRDNNISNIEFINRFVTEEEKHELIARSSFVLFPSVTENEAFGLVQLEAMRSKKAIINTWLSSGVNYVAPNKICALTVTPQNPFELAAAIQVLWEDSRLVAILGQNGFNRFYSLFREELFVKAWSSLVNEYLIQG